MVQWQVTTTGLNSQGSMMLIFCLMIGAMTGEWFDIEKRMIQFGVFLNEKVILKIIISLLIPL